MRQEHFEKEGGMAQRMAQLYREAKEERAAKCTELEGVVQELKAHMEVGGWQAAVWVAGGGLRETSSRNWNIPELIEPVAVVYHEHRALLLVGCKF